MDPSVAVPDFWQFIASMGVGGVLAAYAFYINNKNQKDHVETIKGWNETEKGRTNMLVDVVKDVSVNISKNNTLLDSLHRRLDKDEVNGGVK